MTRRRRVITADGLDNADRAKDAIDEIGIQADIVHRYEDDRRSHRKRGSDEMHVGSLEIDATVGADPRR